MNKNKLYKLSLTSFVICCLLLSAADLQAKTKLGSRKSKEVSAEIQTTSPDDTLFFEEAFPRPEELKIHEKQTGSLWSDSYNSHLYTNLHRASRIGDTVTIIIEETASGSKTAETKAERKSSHSLNLGGFFGLITKLATVVTGFDGSKAIDVAHNNKHEGKGETKRKGSLEAKITARIVKVLRNGDMMVQGKKNIKVNNEEQSLIVEGFISPYNISADNTISSTYVADAKIVLTGFGAVADKQKQGWLTRILDHIMPF